MTPIPALAVIVPPLGLPGRGFSALQLMHGTN